MLSRSSSATMPAPPKIPVNDRLNKKIGPPLAAAAAAAAIKGSVGPVSIIYQ